MHRKTLSWLLTMAMVLSLMAGAPLTAFATGMDTDGDGIPDIVDNAPLIANPDQADADGDGVGDVADNAPLVANPDQADADSDGVGDVADNAPLVANPDQADADGDGIGDVADNAPLVANPDQADADGDGIGDVADNAPFFANPDQKDSDADGVGDVADATPYGTAYDIEAGSVVIGENGYYFIYGAGNATANTITVSTGVTAAIRLSGVNVNVSATVDACAFDIQGTADVTLTLVDGSASTFRSGGNKAGIQVADGAGLTIGAETLGTGILNAFGGWDGAGIGGGSIATLSGGGVIVINDGVINATGGYDGAGIGSGDGGDGCDVTIGGGTVTATGAADGAGIGAGGGGDVGSIAIHGGTVIAASSGNEGSYYGGCGIGSGDGGSNGAILIDGGTVTATGKYDCPGIGGYYNGAGETITISGDTTVVGATGGLYAAAIGGGYGGGGGTILIEGGTVTATGRYRGAGIGDYSGSDTVIWITGGDITSTGGNEACGLGRGYYSAGIYNVATLIFDGGHLTVGRGVDAPYDINAAIGTTAGEDFSAGGCFVPQSGQVIALVGPTVGVFSYDKSGTALADGNTVVGTGTASPAGYFVLSPKETDLQIIRQSGSMSWSYAADTAGPALTAVGVVRTSSSTAEITFSSSEFAQYYYTVVGDGEIEPPTETDGSGTYCDGETVLSIGTLTAGAKDLYLVAKDAAGNVGSSIMIDIAQSHVCKIGNTGYATLADAITAVGDGETKTITLLTDITTNTDICFGGKNVNFDLNGYDLSVATLLGETGLHTAAANITIDDADGGEFNVSGCNIGLDVATGSVTVTSVTTKDGNGIGVIAGSGAVVTVKGDITMPAGVGAAVSGGGILVVEGEIEAVSYVDVDDSTLAKEDGVAGEGAYADYLKYAADGGTSIVYVKNPSVCQIGTTGYSTLTGALSAVTEGQTIELLTDITYDAEITASDKSYTVDLNGKTLTVTSEAYGLSAYNGNTLTVAGPGTLTVNVYKDGSNCLGMYAFGTGSAVTVESTVTATVTAGGAYDVAAYAIGGGSVTVTGSVTANGISGCGAYAYDGSTVSVTGSVSGGRYGAFAYGSDSHITVTGNAAAIGNSTNFASAAYANGGGATTCSVTVTGTATVTGIDAYCVRAVDGGTLTVGGNVTATGINGYGAYVDGGGTATVEGTVTATTYILVGGTEKTAADKTTPTTLTGYLTYTDGTNTVWVKTTEDTPSGGGGGSSTPIISVKTTTAGARVTNSTGLTPTSASGTATAGITPAIANALLSKANSTGGTGKKDVMEVAVDTPDGTETLKVSIPQSSLGEVASKTDCALSVTSPFISVSFDGKAIDTIAGAASGGTVVITAGLVDGSTLSAADRALAGGRPVYDFTVTNGTAQVSDFGGGHATVAIPYKLAAGENPNHIVIYYLGDDGALKAVRGHYDAATKTVTFKTAHFSKFVIGYNAVKFDDVAAGVWYQDAAEFLAAHGVTTGVEEGLFAPEDTLTRGQFIVMLMRAYGVEPEENLTENFADAGDTYYTNYLGTARKLGITSGVGENLFAPDEAITREELFTLLYRTLDVLDELPTDETGNSLANYSDSGEISDFATAAFEKFVASGTLSGSDGRLNPKGNSTRAQMAQVLYNLLSK